VKAGINFGKFDMMDKLCYTRITKYRQPLIYETCGCKTMKMEGTVDENESQNGDVLKLYE